MQKETERQEQYPITRAKFCKIREPEIGTHEFVNLIQAGEFDFKIETGVIYGFDVPQLDGAVYIEQNITCKFPATAEWIYAKCKSICNACNNGDIITDIPFKSE